jgi:hypothetical protein
LKPRLGSLSVAVAAFSAAGVAAAHADVATGRSLFANRFEGNAGGHASGGVQLSFALLTTTMGYAVPPR